MDMIVQGIMPAQMEEMGYDVQSKVVNFEDSPEFKDFSSQRARLEKEARTYQQQMDSSMTMDKKTTASMGLRSVNTKLDDLDQKIADARGSYSPTTSFDFRKLESPAVESARKAYMDQVEKYKGKPFSAAYGMAMDPKLKAAKKAYEDAKVKYEGEQASAYDAKQHSQKTLMEKVQKFFDGDFSITEEQKNLIAENFKPIKAAVTEMFDKATAEFEKVTGKRYSEAEKTAMDQRGEAEKSATDLLGITKRTFDEFNARVKETGMSMSAALDAVGSQIKENGVDMETALKGVMSAHSELLKMGIEDYTGKITKQVASNAAAMGRSPDDPEYQNEIRTNVARQVKEGQLNLAAMESQGLIGIKQHIGDQLVDVGNARVGVAERTGGQLESSALQRGGAESSIAQRLGDARLGIASDLGANRLGIATDAGNWATNAALNRGQAMVGLESDMANARWNVGAGMPPQQIGTAMSVSQYQDAQAQQRIANASAAAGLPLSVAGSMQQERFAQPTSTTTTSMSPFAGIMGGLTGLVGGGASIYGSLSQASAMRSMANMYGG